MFHAVNYKSSKNQIEMEKNKISVSCHFHTRLLSFMRTLRIQFGLWSLA